MNNNSGSISTAMSNNLKIILRLLQKTLKKAFIIMRKELMTYYTTPIGYIVITVFLLITGWFFFSSFFLDNRSELVDFFELLPVIFALAIPAVTMRLFSEEKNTGSFEILMTLPVSLYDVVLGKLLAGIVFAASMLAPTLFYVIAALITGSPDIGPIIGGYIGAILLGGAFSAIGIFSSSLTKNQIIALIIGVIICLTLSIINKFSIILPSSLVNFLENFGADYHFRNFTRGIINSRDIIYFLSIMAIGLIGTVQILEERR